MSNEWQTPNAEGLELARQGQWDRATSAFEQALAVVEVMDAAGTVTLPANADVRARLLLNIGQCHFHTGLLEDARRFAERSCALRVSLYGEDSLVVARTRGDLAVILAASGFTDEALSLLERAVAAVERKRGAESAHLLPLLTNAARLLARSDSARAKPYVERLKALMFAQRLANNATLFPPSDVPVHSFTDAPGSSGSDDHLLRAAVAQTVDLLRSTPTANVAMGGSLMRTRDFERERDQAAQSVDTGQAMHLHEAVGTCPERPVVAETSAAAAADDDDTVAVTWEYEVLPAVAAPAQTPTVAFHEASDDIMFDLVEPPPPTLSELPDPATKAAEKAMANPLGFDVEYGIPAQLNESLSNPTAPLPLDASGNGSADADVVHPVPAARSGIRAVGGVRRGSTQVIAMSRLWIIGGVAAFGGGIGAFFLLNYLQNLLR